LKKTHIFHAVREFKNGIIKCTKIGNIKNISESIGIDKRVWIDGMSQSSYPCYE